MSERERGREIKSEGETKEGRSSSFVVGVLARSRKIGIKTHLCLSIASVIVVLLLLLMLLLLLL